MDLPNGGDNQGVDNWIEEVSIERQVVKEAK